MRTTQKNRRGRTRFAWWSAARKLIAPKQEQKQSHPRMDTTLARSTHMPCQPGAERGQVI